MKWYAGFETFFSIIDIAYVLFVPLIASDKLIHGGFILLCLYSTMNLFQMNPPAKLIECVRLILSPFLFFAKIDILMKFEAVSKILQPFERNMKIFYGVYVFILFAVLIGKYHYRNKNKKV